MHMVFIMNFQFYLHSTFDQLSTIPRFVVLSQMYSHPHVRYDECSSWFQRLSTFTNVCARLQFALASRLLRDLKAVLSSAAKLTQSRFGNSSLQIHQSAHPVPALLRFSRASTVLHRRANSRAHHCGDDLCQKITGDGLLDNFVEEHLVHEAP